MRPATRLALRLLVVYTLGFWVWVGGTGWSIMAAIVALAHGVVSGYTMRQEESDRVFGNAMAAARSLRRLGGAGVNGWAALLALYGAMAAYPAAYGRPHLVEFAPVDGSLVRGGGLLAMWVAGLGLMIAISAYRQLQNDYGQVPTGVR